MPRAVILLPALLLGGWSALTLSAQEAPDPTPEQIVEDWLASSHADAMSESFRHWDGEGDEPDATPHWNGGDGGESDDEERE